MNPSIMELSQAHRGTLEGKRAEYKARSAASAAANIQNFKNLIEAQALYEEIHQEVEAKDNAPIDPQLQDRMDRISHAVKVIQEPLQGVISTIIDSLVKLAVLDALINEGSITYERARQLAIGTLQEEMGIDIEALDLIKRPRYFDEKMANAWGVIDDYNRTGGENNIHH